MAGRVAELSVYPVKSTAGTSLGAGRVEARGLVGDLHPELPEEGRRRPPRPGAGADVCR